MDGNEHGQGFAVQGQERRAHPRYSVDEESHLVLVNHGMPVKARIVDLSLEGCRVRTLDTFHGKVGLPVEITFKVKGFAFRFSGIVRWNDGHHLLGLHFVNMIPRRKTELAEVIEEMAATAAERAKTVDQLVAEQGVRAPTLPEIPEMLEAKPVEPVVAEVIEPQIVAKAIEPPAETPAPALSQPADAEISAELEPPGRRPAKPRDRRGQVRHEVDTAATILLVKVGSALRGHILDLSVSGCRIRTDERFPVGIYTRVETEFRLQGLSFRLGGVTQAIHNRYTVGIRFLDLSERKKQQVLDLIDEIEQMRAATAQAGASSSEKQNQADGR
jgi:c-di-GMP-binding flagellar brake protein YcgR